MQSIYDTPATWAAFTFFKKHTVILAAGLHYYCTQDHTSTADFSGDVNDRYYWDGQGLDSQSRQLPRFFWRISYGSPVVVQPKVNVTRFGDSYSQRTSDGINNTLLNFDVGINGMSLEMAAAVGHFLYQRGGAESFYWIGPNPFNIQKRFVCPEWSITPEFYENYSLKAKFEEVAF